MILTPVAEISRRLSERAEEVCRMLLPGGRRYKDQWLAGDVYGAQGESLKVNLTGPHAGEWRDWANPNEHHGDLLDLWPLATGIDAGSALKEAKSFLGIRDPELRRERKKYVKPSSNGEKPLNEAGLAEKWLIGERKLTPEIIKAFRVAVLPERRALVFPCYNPRGELINRSYRTLESGKGKDVWQDKGCAPCLFGWHTLCQSVYRKRRIIICEGHIDCMTWKQWGIDALSVPNGSGQTWIDYEWDHLAAFERIYLSLDMDEAGREQLPEITRRLGAHRCYHIELPEKDANDCLRAGYTAGDAGGWINEAKPPYLEGIVRATDMEERLLTELAPKPSCFTLPFFESSWPGQGFYPRPGEVSVWSGPTESGKTAFLNFFAASLALKNRGVFIASMEMRPETLLARIYRATLASSGTTESNMSLKVFLEECGPFISFADVFGYIGREQLLEMMSYAFHRYGATHHVIDSLMKIANLEEDYVAQGEFLNELQRFAKQTMTHVHLVAHPRKKDGKLDKFDVKGSSQIPNNADNVLIITRNESKQGWEDHDTRVELVKQRDSGWHHTWFLRFDPARYTYSAYTPCK
jgi:twinkle protein